MEKGYAATSVDQICARAGLTKGSFFHHFASKEALAEAVLEHYTTAMEAMVGALLDAGPSDPLARVHAFVDFFRAFARARPGQPSCVVGNLAQELSATNPVLRAKCAACFARMTQVLAEEFAAARDLHRPDSAIDPRELSEHFLVTLEGALLLAKARGDSGVIVAHLDHFERYVRALFESPSGFGTTRERREPSA